MITTHQVEEIENLLTDIMFIDKGRQNPARFQSMDSLSPIQYIELMTSGENAAEMLTVVSTVQWPIFERELFGKSVMLTFERRQP